ncbi:hypothetical protein GLU01_00690 [Nanohaloarchaea archaeon]|nr:hypothetical protein [Candidatus Nanohaloarchaea archaeon]
MLQTVICESCQENEAVDKCQVCGARVCRSCANDYGCDLCGAENTFE